MVAEFARYSKLQRNINKITDELREKKKSRSLNLMKVMYTLKTSVYVVYMFVMFCMFYWYRSQPVVVLPVDWFPYVNRVLSIPTGVEGAIGLPGWVLLSRQ